MKLVRVNDFVEITIVSDVVVSGKAQADLIEKFSGGRLSNGFKKLGGEVLACVMKRKGSNGGIFGVLDPVYIHDKCRDIYHVDNIKNGYNLIHDRVLEARHVATLSQIPELGQWEEVGLQNIL